MSASARISPKRTARARAWWAAIRPKTLTVAFAPVLVGTSLAAAEGALNGLVASAALLGALLIQIGTNLFNDYGDFVRGADADDRLGPPRATQQGWLRPNEVRAASLLCLGLAFVVGIYLVAVGGWPIVVLGLVSLLSAVWYTAGPAPLAYTGLADLFVLVFFGLVAVGATYYLQTGALSAGALFAGAAVGLLAMSILVLNNIRDRFSDARANKRTLVVRFGESFGRREYRAALLGAYLLVGIAALSGIGEAFWLVTFATLPLALWQLRRADRVDGPGLNVQLAKTAQLQLAFSLALAVGIVL